MKQEAKYFDLIDLINSGYEVNTSSESGNTTRTLLVIFLKYIFNQPLKKVEPSGVAHMAHNNANKSTEPPSFPNC